MSYFAAVKYTLPAPVTNPTLTITFPYIDYTDLRVFKEIPPVPPDTEPTYDYFDYGTADGWSLPSVSQVQVEGNFLAGDVIWIRRFTRRDQRLAEYFDGSTLTEQDLNSVTLQLLYLIQEIMDSVGLGNMMVGGAPGGGGGGLGGQGPNIDDIIAQLLNSQLFQDLIALIELTDLNAEAIMHNALRVHERWMHAQVVDHRFSPEGFNGYLNAASVILGIRSDVDANGASVESIASYLVGSGVTVNPDGTINWGVPADGSLAHSLSILQQLVSVHATQLATEAAFRQILASSFAPGSADTPASLVAGIEQAWRTYADEESTTAQLATQLAVNRQPIIFQGTAPNPYTDPEWDTFSENGFPDGSLWYKQVGATMRPFWWKRGATAVPSPAPDEYYGPFPEGPGMWLPNRDTNLFAAVGAQINQNFETGIYDGYVEALFETQLTTVFGVSPLAAVNTIAQNMVSYVNTEDGHMYSNWTVRINQTLGTGTPVIAGMGLGLQTDPATGASLSSMIVMANQFAVIAPPEVPADPVTDPIDPDSIEVPFIIDTATGKVIVNGTLLARSFRSLDAYIGRLTVTQMNLSTLEPVNPLGQRLVLPSNTGAGNVGVGLSPFTGLTQRFLIWAGDGDMGHNNAIFYVDTDGNAVFNGEILADNIVGTVNDTVVINQVLPSNVTTGATYVQLGAVETLPAQGLKTRKAVATVAIALFGNDATAQEARLQMRTTEVGQAYPSWTTVAECTVNTGTGTTLTLVGSLPTAVRGPVELKVEFRRTAGSGLATSNRFNGIFMGVR